MKNNGKYVQKWTWRPEPPLTIRKLESGGCGTCPKCGSSQKKTVLWFFGKKRCIHPKCGHEE